MTGETVFYNSNAADVMADIQQPWMATTHKSQPNHNNGGGNTMAASDDDKYASDTARRPTMNMNWRASKQAESSGRVQAMSSHVAHKRYSYCQNKE